MGAEHEVVAVVAVAFLQGRGRGFAEGGVGWERVSEAAVEGLGGEFGALLVLGANDDEDEVAEGRVVAYVGLVTCSEAEVAGVNDRTQLAAIEAVLQAQYRKRDRKSVV